MPVVIEDHVRVRLLERFAAGDPLPRLAEEAGLSTPDALVVVRCAVAAGLAAERNVELAGVRAELREIRGQLGALRRGVQDAGRAAERAEEQTKRPVPTVVSVDPPRFESPFVADLVRREIAARVLEGTQTREELIGPPSRDLSPYTATGRTSCRGDARSNLPREGGVQERLPGELLDPPPLAGPIDAPIVRVDVDPPGAR